jgi:hypothetical protein
MPDCSAPGPSDGPWGCCTKNGPGTFAEPVEAAVEAAKLRPELVRDGKVISEDAYIAAIVAHLRAAGYCAVRGGPSDEVGVKARQHVNEQWDVLLSNGSPYAFVAATCRPARF